MSGDDIIDAEWDDVPEERPAVEPARLTDAEQKQSYRPPQPSPERTGSPWRDGDFWRETARTILIAVGRMGAIALVLVVLFFFIIAWANHDSSSASGSSEAALNGRARSGQQAYAEDMLRSWSKEVTGQADASGFALVNGDGKPGDFCNNANGDRLLKFGGEQIAGANVYDFYSEFHGTTKSGIVGAFWYDPSEASLLTRNQASVSSDGERGKSVPDLVHQADTAGRGRATIDGTSYHVCTL
jgi:hypothetical protein